MPAKVILKQQQVNTIFKTEQVLSGEEDRNCLVRVWQS